MLWSRTINVHGQSGKNIPMDLHIEQLNSMFKGSKDKLGATNGSVITTNWENSKFVT